MQQTPVGIDIAKSVFQVHHVDVRTGEVVNKTIPRTRFLEGTSKNPLQSWPHWFEQRSPVG